MAGKVLPLLGPSTPITSIAFGALAGSILTVPVSFGPGDLVVYFPSSSTSVIDLSTSSGSLRPPTSPETKAQVPSIAFASFVSGPPARAAAEKATTPTAESGSRSMANLQGLPTQRPDG